MKSADAQRPVFDAGGEGVVQAPGGVTRPAQKFEQPALLAHVGQGLADSDPDRDLEQPAAHGKVFVHFFPLGTAEKTVIELATDLGHDSFLLESEQLYTLVRGFFERDQLYTFDYAI